MIAYNVDRRWFTMKADAEAYRKELGLPPSGTYTLRIDNREELVALLNGLTGIAPAEQEVTNAPETPASVPVPPEVITRNAVSSIPDCVPLFLIKDWERRNKPKQRDDDDE